MAVGLQSILDALDDSVRDAVLASHEAADMPTLVIDAAQIVALCTCLKDAPTLRFDFLCDLCGVDFFPDAPRFQVVYHLYSIAHKHRLRLKCKVAEDATIASVTPVWNTANWHERETYDMYGIVLANHPDLRRIYMWEEFEGWPMRKDFPLRGYKDQYNPFGEEGRPEGPH